MRRALVGWLLVPVLLALAGCAVLGGPAAERTLAKVDGRRDGASDGGTFATLELAFDAATAERLWADNVPAGLAAADGVPGGTGVYGDLADVDLATSVVALWSSGQSGSCPEWVREVRMVDGVVTVDRAQDGDVCTADYNPYRLVLVLDRRDVPPVEDLPAAMTVGEGIVVPSQVLVYGR